MTLDETVDALWAEIDKRATHQTAGMESVVKRLLRRALREATGQGATATAAVMREVCRDVAVAEVWAAHEAESKAISKGCGEYTRAFRTANLAERVAAAIMDPGQDGGATPGAGS